MLDLDGNSLSGPLDGLEALSQLQYLTAAANQLSGLLAPLLLTTNSSSNSSSGSGSSASGLGGSGGGAGSGLAALAALLLPDNALTGGLPAELVTHPALQVRGLCE
jgi:hypothetical protein